MNDEIVQKKLRNLEEERAHFIRQAELQVAVFDGGIQALRQLLAPDAPAPVPHPPAPNGAHKERDHG
jgi:hypothetical protein